MFYSSRCQAVAHVEQRSSHIADAVVRRYQIPQHNDGEVSALRRIDYSREQRRRPALSAPHEPAPADLMETRDPCHCCGRRCAIHSICTGICATFLLAAATGSQGPATELSYMLPAATINLLAFTDSPYAQQLRLGFRWLSFPAELEREYCQFHVARVRGRVRVFLALVPALVIAQWIKTGVGLNDWWSALFQILLMFTFLMVANGLVWSRQIFRLYLPIVTPISAVLLLTSASQLPRAGVTDGYLEALEFVLNVPLMTHLFLGLPFYRALLINALCTIAFFGVAMHFGISAVAMETFICVVPVSMLAATLIAYTAELESRKYFLQEKLLGEIASRDPLTGLHNRATFDSHLEMLWKDGQRNG
jgi:hypothetical protein